MSLLIVFGVIYFNMNKDEKRKIAVEGSSIVASAQKIVDNLERSCIGKFLCSHIFYVTSKGFGDYGRDPFLIFA